MTTDYRLRIEQAATAELPWELLEGSNLLVTGATGLIGGCLVDVLTVSYTHLTLPTKLEWCRSRWSPYH